jgi:hypothetical protein
MTLGPLGFKDFDPRDVDYVNNMDQEQLKIEYLRAKRLLKDLENESHKRELDNLALSERIIWIKDKFISIIDSTATSRTDSYYQLHRKNEKQLYDMILNMKYEKINTGGEGQAEENKG